MTKAGSSQFQQKFLKGSFNLTKGGSNEKDNFKNQNSLETTEQSLDWNGFYRTTVCRCVMLLVPMRNNSRHKKSFFRGRGFFDTLVLIVTFPRKSVTNHGAISKNWRATREKPIEESLQKPFDIFNIEQNLNLQKALIAVKRWRTKSNTDQRGTYQFLEMLEKTLSVQFHISGVMRQTTSK